MLRVRGEPAGEAHSVVDIFAAVDVRPLPETPQARLAKW
jgi:hypothetical protein